MRRPRFHRDRGRCALSLLKHDCPVPVQEHPSFDERVDGAGQRDALNVAPDGKQLVRPVRMIDTLDDLLDDRAFVEIVGDASALERSLHRANGSLKSFDREASRVGRGVVAGSGAFRGLLRRMC